MSEPREATPMDRRDFVAYFSALGLGGTLLPGVLWARLQQEPQVTPEMIAQAEHMAGLEFTPEERENMAKGLTRELRAYEALRKVPLENAVTPAIRFDPVLPGTTLPAERTAMRPSRPEGVKRPAKLEDVAFWPVTKLAELIRTRQVTSEELTRMYLDRLKRFGPKLEAVITLTEERALERAKAADEKLRGGTYLGPLHGIPWGAKDLLAVKGYPTTWGAEPYEQQVLDYDATVVQRLDAAGAVLLAKLTLGALAQGDVWFGGKTRNPWNLEQGSSGSSAGPAAATVAGLVGFSIGSETLGSIVSPSTRTGATGLRPTFGRVPRTGAMALSWSMDKLGPICRSVEDCALVLAVINGPDGQDLTVHDVPFNWDATVRPQDLRVGYLKAAFEDDHPTKSFDEAALAAVRSLGVDAVPVAMPDDLPVQAVRATILSMEAAAAFDELTRSGRDALMEERSSWPETFREARFVPAVEYINANRVRTLLMEQTRQALDGIDVLVTPSFGGDILVRTNLTGHPTVVVPSGFKDDGTPVSISFVGQLWGEAKAAALAKAYQDATGFHQKTPPNFGVAS